MSHSLHVFIYILLSFPTFLALGLQFMNKKSLMFAVVVNLRSKTHISQLKQDERTLKSTKFFQQLICSREGKCNLMDIELHLLFKRVKDMETKNTLPTINHKDENQILLHHKFKYLKVNCQNFKQGSALKYVCTNTSQV